MVTERVKQDQDCLILKERLLRTSNDSWSDLFKDSPLPDWGSVTIRELSCQGATSRQFLIHVPMPIDGGRKFFVKQYVSTGDDRDFWENQLRRDFSISKILSKKFEASPWFKVPRPYRMIPEELILVTEFVEGQNLGQLFFKQLRLSRLFSPPSSFERLKNLVQRIGQGLAELQLIDLDDFVNVIGPPNLGDYLQKLLQSIDENSKYLEELRCFPDLVSWGKRTFERVIAGSDLSHIMCFQHTDFMLHNFIVDCQGNLSIFDFPNAAFGLPYFDAAHFVSSLEDLSYLYTVSEKRIESLVRSFLLALGTREPLDPVVLDAFRVYFQFLSTVIMLKARRRRNRFFRCLLLEHTLERFKRRLPQLLKDIDSGKGALINIF